jgi:hypothetical protein
MHIEIDDERMSDRAFGVKRFRRNGNIVEDTEARPRLPLPMMTAAGRATCKTVLERQSRGKQRSRGGSSRAAHHALADGKADPPLDFAGNGAGT